jgi:hypothetical protein
MMAMPGPKRYPILLTVGTPELINSSCVLQGLGRHFLVGWGGRKRNLYCDVFCPWSGGMKPDTPSIHRCLREAGYDVLHA